MKNPYKDLSDHMGRSLIESIGQGIRASGEVHKLMDSPLTLKTLVELKDLEQVAEAAIRGLATQPSGYVLAVDFDGTLCENIYPEIGLAHNKTIEAVKKVRALGVKVILWTCREEGTLLQALTWCNEHGLEFDAINNNTEERQKAYGNNCRKIGYDELWDDRAHSAPFADDVDFSSLYENTPISPFDSWLGDDK